MLVLSTRPGEGVEVIVDLDLMKAMLESIGAKVELPADVEVEPFRVRVVTTRVTGHKVRTGFIASFNSEKLGKEVPIRRDAVIARIEEARKERTSEAIV